MSPALKAALTRLGTLLLATVAGSGVHPAIVRAQADTQQVPAGPNDEATWTAARKAGTAAAYQRYLELFPIGAYAEDAFRLLVENSLRTPRPVPLIQIEPGAGPPGLTRELQVAAADLALY